MWSLMALFLNQLWKNLNESKLDLNLGEDKSMPETNLEVPISKEDTEKIMLLIKRGKIEDASLTLYIRLLTIYTDDKFMDIKRGHVRSTEALAKIREKRDKVMNTLIELSKNI